MKSILMSDFVLLNYDVGGGGGGNSHRSVMAINLTRTPRKCVQARIGNTEEHTYTVHTCSHGSVRSGSVRAAFRVIAERRQLAWPSLT